VTDEPARPDPDALLTRIKAEEKKETRGKLKVFFGSSAGVGKTYAMLTAAHEQRREGIDVVAGIVETHNRPETEKLLGDLPVIAPLSIDYRGVTLKELDLDAAKARAPKVLLVDELAHTNAPGTRHPKRWNDVMELLDAGIDVFTTLNVQHIESLSDVIAGTTGVWVRETVPDSLFDAADEIILVDIDADDLLKRLNEGKVYVAPQVKARAAANFFRKNNLIALRELALLRTAARVDAQMNAYNDSEGIHDRLPVAEKIMVCIGPDHLSAKLVRTAKRLATAIKAPWMAVYIENLRHQSLNERGRRAVESVSRMVERIGGKMVVLQGDNAVDDLIACAHENRITKIIIGKSVKSTWRTFFYGSLADKIIRKCGAIDVYVVTGEAPGSSEPVFNGPFAGPIEPKHYLWSLLTVAILTAFGYALRGILPPADQALIYLTGIVIVASRFGRGPSLFYALLSIACFNFFFIAPLAATGAEERSWLMTFLIMLITGVVITNQASRLRLQALNARQRERHTQTLYSLTRSLASARGRRNITEIVARQIAAFIDSDVTVWLPGPEGHLTALVGALPEASFAKELGVLQWCFDNAKTAGRTTTTMPSAAGLYLPLIASTGTLGVLGILPKDPDRMISLDEISSLETLASLLASGIERVNAAEQAEKARLEAEIEKLRNLLLTAGEEGEKAGG
jgi:two-component system sensor histidine kinase KdpD